MGNVAVAELTDPDGRRRHGTTQATLSRAALRRNQQFHRDAGNSTRAVDNRVSLMREGNGTGITNR